MLVGMCPFYMYDRGNMLFCEGATLKYPDKKAKKDHLDCYCCNGDSGYKKCMVNSLLENYYERLYNGETVALQSGNNTIKKRGRKKKAEGGI